MHQVQATSRAKLTNVLINATPKIESEENNFKLNYGYYVKWKELKFKTVYNLEYMSCRCLDRY